MQDNKCIIVHQIKRFRFRSLNLDIPRFAKTRKNSVKERRLLTKVQLSKRYRNINFVLGSSILAVIAFVNLAKIISESGIDFCSK